MTKISLILLLSVPLCLAQSCSTSYRPHQLQYSDYRVRSSTAHDPELLAVIKPYGDSVNLSMNEVVGNLAVSMDKKLPEGTLGNFMTDAYITMAAEKFGRQVDIAMMNYGGIRLTQLPAGPVTRGKMYELMPFDNLLILQELKGSVLQQLLDHIAARGGWPVAGMTMQMRDKKAINVMVGGKPIDPEAVYVVANSDFVANGGDNAEMLKTIPQLNRGYLMREALFDYIKKLKSEGRPLMAAVENRVTNG